MTPEPLWTSTDDAQWQSALARYGEVIAAQGVASLADHDRWYHGELPAALRSRRPSYATHEELVRLTEWKMARGVWRARNLVLVRGNSSELVERTTADAFAAVPHESAPIAKVAELAGVGPATSSALLAAYAPEVYPFFDELVAHQIPGLGPVAFTPAYYKRYAQAIRERSSELGGDWTPARVERALWSHVGGKVGTRSAH
jgi:hypothetical protein